MIIELHHRLRDLWCSLTLADDRKALASVLPFLNAESVDAMKIVGYPSDRLPAAIFALDGLESLEFCQCPLLSGIPASLSRFAHLCELAFVDCPDFHDIMGISELGSLRALHIVNCASLDAVGGEFSACGQLELLDLSHNPALKQMDVSRLPKNIRILDLRGCFELDVEDLPDAAWPALVSLNAVDWTRSGTLPTDHVKGVSSKMRHLCTRRRGATAEAE